MNSTQARVFSEASKGNPNSPGVVCCLACGASDNAPFLTAPDRFHGKVTPYELRRCTACSHVWLSNPPSPEQIGEHYGSQYDWAISTAAEARSDRWHRERKTLLRYRSSGAILDLGCSSGSFLATVADCFETRFGVEISSEMALRAERNSGAHVFVGDILEASFPQESFDAVTCFHVLEHMYEPRRTVAKVWKWLKPGGVFYVLVPNIDAGESRIFGSYWYPLELPRHLSHFCPTSLQRLGARVGLKAEYVSTFRVSFIEPSTRYILESAKSRCGLSFSPLSLGKHASLPWKVIRKILRMTVLPVAAKLESFAGAGEVVEGIFLKQ